MAIWGRVLNIQSLGSCLLHAFREILPFTNLNDAYLGTVTLTKHNVLQNGFFAVEPTVFLDYVFNDSNLIDAHISGCNKLNVKRCL